MPIPGNPGSYVANGSEHDGMGDTTHLAQRHIQMTNRRFNKIKLLEDGTYESNNTNSSIAIMPWGGSKGPAQAAYAEFIVRNPDLAWYYTMFLNPLPPKLLEELKQKELVIIPELNFQGQFSSILRSYGVRAESITQITGLPFKVSFLVEKIGEMVQQENKKRVTA